MSWLNTEVRFARRAVILTLPRRLAIAEGSLHDLIRHIETSAGPETLHGFVRTLIAIHQPKLKLPTIYFMGFDARTDSYEFGIEHPLLPEVCDGCELRRYIINDQQLPIGDDHEDGSARAQSLQGHGVTQPGGPGQDDRVAGVRPADLQDAPHDQIVASG